MTRLLEMQMQNDLEMAKLQGAHSTLLRRKNGEYARLWKMQSGGFLADA